MSRLRRGPLPPRILITAGPTREPLDPVRYLSNHSSGEMGLALAAAFQRGGARVTVVLGPVARDVPRGLEVIPVMTALEMSTAVRRRLRSADVFIATAAVADWRPAKSHLMKMKKGSARGMTIRLVANPDILADAGRARGRRALPILVGFALETHDLSAQTAKKLSHKNLDLIIGNGPESFARPSIKPLWLERGGVARALPRLSKKALSSMIARWTFQRLQAMSASAR